MELIAKSLALDIGDPSLKDKIILALNKNFGDEFTKREWKYFEKNSMATHNNGKVGEDYVMDIISKIRPTFEINNVASTGHLGDLHVTDNRNKIRYIVEVKNKTTVTYYDVDKFRHDMEGYPYEFGIFVSLLSDRIPDIGDCAIDSNVIFITKKYVTEESFKLIFDYFTMIHLMRTARGSSACGASTCRTSDDKAVMQHYIISPNVYSLFTALKTYQKRIQDETTTLSKVKESLISSATQLDMTLCEQANVKTLINKIFDELSMIHDMDSAVIDVQHRELKAYIQSRKKSQIHKTELLNEFPLLRTELGSLNLEDIIRRYS